MVCFYFDVVGVVKSYMGVVFPSQSFMHASSGFHSIFHSYQVHFRSSKNVGIRDGDEDRDESGDEGLGDTSSWNKTEDHLHAGFFFLSLVFFFWGGAQLYNMAITIWSYKK